jgi:hypothetical protein
MKISKTKMNLQVVRNQLDDAYNLLEKVFNTLDSMKLSNEIKDSINLIDISTILCLKRDVEEVMEQTKNMTE